MMGSILAISWTISRFEPLNMLAEFLPNKIVYNLFRLMIGCFKCLSLWIGLAMTGNLAIAAVLAFIAFWYDKLIGPIERKIRL